MQANAGKGEWEGMAETNEGRKWSKAGWPKEKTLTYDNLNERLYWKKTDKFSITSMFSKTVADEDSKCVFVQDICEVRKGIHTEVFRAARGAIDPYCCLSIHTSDRSLDLQLKTMRDRDLIFRAVQRIVNETHKRKHLVVFR